MGLKTTIGLFFKLQHKYKVQKSPSWLQCKKKSELKILCCTFGKVISTIVFVPNQSYIEKKIYSIFFHLYILADVLKRILPATTQAKANTWVTYTEQLLRTINDLKSENTKADIKIESLQSEIRTILKEIAALNK